MRGLVLPAFLALFPTYHGDTEATRLRSETSSYGGQAEPSRSLSSDSASVRSPGSPGLRGSSLKLKIGAQVDDVVIEDVDADGRPDIIVQSARDLRVFLNVGGAFKPEPSSTLRLDSNVFLWCFATMCDAKGRVLVTSSVRGIHRHVGLAKQGEDLVIHPNLFEGTLGDGRGPTYTEIMPDLDGDGLGDALLFQAGQMLVLPQAKGADGRPEFKLRQRLDIPVEGSLKMGWMAHQKVIETTRVPMLVFGDVDGNGKTDISWYRNEAFGAWLQQPDNRFKLQEPKDLATKKRRLRIPYFQFEAPPFIVDINGDGLLDVVLSHPSKGRVHLYMNRSGRTDFTTPDEIIAIDGWVPGLQVLDIDSDGKPEIVIGIIRKLGLSSGLEAFTTKKVRVELMFFKADAEGKYSNEPLQQLEFRIPYTATATREAATVDLTFRPSLDADLDGDGRRELIVEKDIKTFEVYRGVAGKLVAGEAEPAFEIVSESSVPPAFTRLQAADLDGDKKSDLIIRRHALDRKLDEVEVRMSR